MKAIALISGGLDSILAARVVKQQGIEVVALKFKIPFGHNKDESGFDAGLEIKEIDIQNGFFGILTNPRHGFGSNMNPCIDCKILMLRKAKELMQEYDAKFIITGEVLGQRPMSQHKTALKTIVKDAGLDGLVLRPLSARLLEETIPEKEGWVKRERLLSFSGRGRKPQIALAKTFGIQEYAQPAGGCLLTDRGFSMRLKDLLAYEGLSRNNVELLKIGRHFRLSEKAKLVVGRDENENKQLLNFAKADDYLFMPNDELAGPTAVGRGLFNDELIVLSCSITVGHCDLNGKASADIVYKRISDTASKARNVSPLEENRVSALRI
jgi:tRNA U34 2-thiouridine synthase MnmA/TrmU